jgi:phosphotriesterase-related protein
VGEPGGGKFGPYDYFFTAVAPALREAGLSQQQVSQLTDVNPRRALTASVRLARPASGG